MPRQDTTDFLTAFAVGTVLGIGATLLLRPEPRRSARKRLSKELRPYGRRLRQNYEDARWAVRDSARVTGDASGEVISLGKELLGEFRGEVARILNEARDDLRDLAQDRVHDVRRQARRAGRKLGLRPRRRDEETEES